MTYQSRLARLVFAVLVMACATAGSTVLVAAEGGLAGQMCPAGSYVIGFDSESNIVCSSGGEKTVPASSKTETVETCSGDCQSADVASEVVANEAATAAEVAVEIVEKSAPANPGDAPSIVAPGISKVTPSNLVFGTRKVEITINGTGFLESSVVVFTGKQYMPSVNQAGTQLLVTIPARNLSIGSYAITVSNGPGLETTLKKALRVY